MFEMSGDLKTILDIGLGALAFLLWLRQGKINRAQVELDNKQNITSERLTTMVEDHEERLRSLESTRRPARHHKKGH